MAKLTAAQRKKLPKGKFALPGERKFPIPDAAHAANAKARATQQYDRGRLAKSTMQKIDAAANTVLHRNS